jgi:hypothetical protein
MLQEECSLNGKYINIQTHLGLEAGSSVGAPAGKHEVLRLNHSTNNNKKYQYTNNTHFFQTME